MPKKIYKILNFLFLRCLKNKSSKIFHNFFRTTLKKDKTSKNISLFFDKLSIQHYHLFLILSPSFLYTFGFCCCRMSSCEVNKQNQSQMSVSRACQNRGVQWKGHKTISSDWMTGSDSRAKGCVRFLFVCKWLCVKWININ